MRAEKPETSPPVSEQMKAWSAALAAELRDWPQVEQKVFFGFTAFYRGKTMFGLLPRTRSIFKDNTLAFRMDRPSRATRALIEKDPRVAVFDKNKARWFTFALTSDSDLHLALDYFSRAFEAASTRNKTK